jgi:hypothetical protein
MFIEKDVWGVMINDFQTTVQIELDMEEEQNPMILPWDVVNSIQQENSKEIAHHIKRCEVQNTPSNVRVF